jgi:predicted ATPase/DNA-binding winged helix-turn-helix (wHTH) protein
LDVAGRRLTEAGRPVAIGDRALDLLIALAERPGEVVPKAELIARAWPSTHVEEANLRVQISAVRRALGGGADDVYIGNAPGRGYRFVAPIARQTLNGAPIERAAIWPAFSAPVGREDEIAAVVDRVRETRLLTIVGPGGIGKTTLALASGKRLAGGLAESAVFAEISSGPDPAIAVGASLGLTLPDADALGALTAYLAPLELLVVLDSCEYAVEAVAGLVEAILRAAPKVIVVATSRESLRAEGELVWRIRPLATPAQDEALSAAEALGYSAVRLFVDRAGAADRGFAFTDADVAAVANICRRLDGLPLAIELAAGRIGAFGLKGIEAGLDDRFQLLGEGRRTAIPRHRTLAAAVDWSYDALSPTEQAALQAFSLAQAPFDAAAAAWLALGPDAGPAAIYAPLASLVAKSLIVADTAAAPAEYRLLDTTRDYARMKLAAAGALSEAAARHAALTIRLLADAPVRLETHSMRDWLDHFSRKLEDARAALEWACSAGGDPSFIAPLTLASLPVLVRLSRYEEAQRWTEAALAIAPSESRDEMALNSILANVLLNTTDSDAGREAASLRAIALADRFQDTETRLRSEFQLWNSHINRADVSAALKDIARYGDLANRDGGEFEAVVGDRMAGVTQLVAGDFAEARAAIDRLLARSPVRDARKRLAWYSYDPDLMARNTLVSLLWIDGAPDSALAAGNDNLARALAGGADVWTGPVLTDGLCLLCHYVGDAETAERRLAHLEMLSARPGVPDNFEHWARLFRAMLDAARGDVAPGLALLGDVLPDWAAHPRYAPVLVELAWLFGRAGAISPARRLADRMLRRIEVNGELWLLSEVQRVRGELCDDETAALALFETAIETARAQGARAWGLRAATSLARRRPGQARRALAPWLDGLTEGLWTPDVVAARALLRGAAA